MRFRPESTALSKKCAFPQGGPSAWLGALLRKWDAPECGWGRVEPTLQCKRASIWSADVSLNSWWSRKAASNCRFRVLCRCCRTHERGRRAGSPRMSLFVLRAAGGPEWHFAAAFVDDDTFCELQDMASPKVGRSDASANDRLAAGRHPLLRPPPTFYAARLRGSPAEAVLAEHRRLVRRLQESLH